MNQILENIKSKKLIKKLYITQFVMLLIIVFSLFVHLLYQKEIQINENKLSKSTYKEYSILKLYSNNNNNNNFSISKNNIFILGTIRIPKINIEYPIFSNYSDELLKISICKFYGPPINSIGNFCMLGHNYNTDKFFSKIHLLRLNDIITLTSSNGTFINYSIYSIYEVSPEDLSYLSQDTNRF